MRHASSERNERNNMNDKDASPPSTRSSSTSSSKRTMHPSSAAKDAEGCASLKCQWHKVCAEYCQSPISHSPSSSVTILWSPMSNSESESTWQQVNERVVRWAGRGSAMFDHYPKPIREPLKCRLLGEGGVGVGGER